MTDAKLTLHPCENFSETAPTFIRVSLRLHGPRPKSSSQWHCGKNLQNCRKRFPALLVRCPRESEWAVVSVFWTSDYPARASAAQARNRTSESTVTRESTCFSTVTVTSESTCFSTPGHSDGRLPVAPPPAGRWPTVAATRIRAERITNLRLLVLPGLCMVGRAQA